MTDHLITLALTAYLLHIVALALGYDDLAALAAWARRVRNGGEG